eukprot:2437674-Ditylum_brightwellii.AAC.1
MDTHKKKCQKCGLDKHWTNQCTLVEKNTPKKSDSKTPWHLVSSAADIVLHPIGDITNQVVNTRSLLLAIKHKKATAITAMLAVMESNTAATLAVTDD